MKNTATFSGRVLCGRVLVVMFFFAGGRTLAAEGISASQTAQPVLIHARTRHPAVQLAAAELARYLGQMAGTPDAAVVLWEPPSVGTAIELGVASDLGVTIRGIEDTDRDDAVYIDVRGSKGILSGPNPRSVLFSAYRFLESCGCRWIRPGRDGDYVPSRPINDLSVKLEDRAFYRFRGNSTPGARSIEFLLDKIAWAPKVGLNTLFNEFFLPRGSYNNYYDRAYPSLKQKEPRSNEEVRAYHELSIREVKRRGMFYHGVGHGWTSLVLGLPESETDHWSRPEMPAGKEWMVALVKGSRDLSRGPTFTDLCYGNPEVRRRLAQCVADYAQSHPEIDYLHVWSDDKMNVTCECELCRHTRLSDLYIHSLNEIDEELTRRKLPTRIVFLIYQDLLWPPEKQRIANPARFTMMFAPISRKYNQPYQLDAADAELPPYQLNQNKAPTDEGAFMLILKSWRSVFPREAFVFDYHMVWHHFHDPGYVGFTDIMAEDIRRLPQMGVQGYVSCQMLRAAFPHAYPLHLHARLLWNPEQDTVQLRSRYFADAFGAGSEEALNYCLKLSDAFAPFYLDRDALFAKDGEKNAALAKLEGVAAIVDAFRPVIEQRCQVAETPVSKRSWHYLGVHAELARKMAWAVRAKASGDQKKANACWQEIAQQVAEDEPQTEEAFDLFYFGTSLRRYFKKEAPLRPRQTPPEE